MVNDSKRFISPQEASVSTKLNILKGVIVLSLKQSQLYLSWLVASFVSTYKILSTCFISGQHMQFKLTLTSDLFSTLTYTRESNNENQTTCSDQRCFQATLKNAHVTEATRCKYEVQEGEKQKLMTSLLLPEWKAWSVRHGERPEVMEEAGWDGKQIYGLMRNQTRDGQEQWGCAALCRAEWELKGEGWNTRQGTWKSETQVHM